MSRPMGFPSRFARLGKLFFFAFVLPCVLFIPADVWLYYSLPPLQKYYLAPYMASSIAIGGRNVPSSIRWLTKTAPKRKPQLAIPMDILDGPDRKLPFQLSASAREAGWQGLVRSAPQNASPKVLSQALQENVYDGVSLWWLFGKPVLLSFAGVVLLCLLWTRTRFGWRGGQTRQAERRHGRRTKGPELGRAWSLRRDGIRLQLEGGSAFNKLVPFAGPSFCIPKRLESSHILLMGDTGAGKSSAIRQILRQVETRGETAIVYDPAMDFVGEFYRPERGDLVLNPLDERCPYWNVAGEVLRPEMATTMAAAFLTEKEYEKSFFTDAPRRVLAHMLRKEPQVRDLLQWMSDPEKITTLVKGTPLAALVDPHAPAQRAGVLASLNLVADSLELLPEWSYERKTFSTAEWHGSRKRWVFLTSNPGSREKILPLHSVWLDLFILRMMGWCEDREAKPVWFVVDELASLNKLPQLHTAVTENRKYGNPVVLGLQGRSQMEKRYGQDAEAMLSQPATKIFFKTSEPRAAKWVSESIGEIEVERLKESRSMGLLGKKNFAMEIATKPLIMASEIAGLAPLRAFIKQENRVMPVRFRLAKKRGRQPEFIERKMPEREPRPEPKAVPPPVAASAIIAPVANQKALLKAAASPPIAAPAPVKKPVAVQKELPLAPAAAKVAAPAFVWDESKGIE